MEIRQSSLIGRILNIDFDLYTSGDLDFKFELTALIVENLVDFMQALNDTIQSHDSRSFLSACHKMTPTVDMLNDDELIQTIATLKGHFKSERRLDDILLHQNTNLFHEICSDLVRALKFEAQAA